MLQNLAPKLSMFHELGITHSSATMQLYNYTLVQLYNYTLPSATIQLYSSKSSFSIMPTPRSYWYSST